MPTHEIVFTIEDRRKKKATTSVKVLDSFAEAAVTGFAQAWADAIDNLIGGVIRSAVAILGVDISGLTSNTATNDSDVEEIASAQFETAEGQIVEVNIPAILETLVVNETGQLDEAAPQVAAFLDMMIDGITVNATLIQPCDVGDTDIIKHNYFRERSRNSGTRKVT